MSGKIEDVLGVDECNETLLLKKLGQENVPAGNDVVIAICAAEMALVIMVPAAFGRR